MWHTSFIVNLAFLHGSQKPNIGTSSNNSLTLLSPRTQTSEHVWNFKSNILDGWDEMRWYKYGRGFVCSSALSTGLGRCHCLEETHNATNPVRIFFVLHLCMCATNTFGIVNWACFKKIFIHRSERIRQTTLKCIVLNGLIFLGFLYVFNYYMKSILHSIMSLLVSTMSKEEAGISENKREIYIFMTKSYLNCALFANFQ